MREKKQRVALVGASTRAMYAFAAPLIRQYGATHEVVGMFDIVPRRMAALNEFINVSIPAFHDFDRMMTEARPDVVVISTIDATHADYIERAFRYGVNCVSEKPLCTDADQCARIRAAQAERPDLVAVTAHNYRYAPSSQKIKALLEEGAIGKARSIVFQEMLDQRHGSSYFRRWNRKKANSGGLLVHKACHCFDLMNWWVGSRAKTLVARGSLTAYGPHASAFRGERCCECEHTAYCPQYLDLSKSNLRARFYLKAREPGSYTPDLCVFDPEIDIEDHATVGYEYENGVQVTFDLCAYTAYEGVHVAIEGSKGRLEYVHGLSTKALDKGVQHGVEKRTAETLRLLRFDQGGEEIAIPEVEGGHGGADPAMLRDLFGNEPTNARASLEDGIQAVLIGAAANVSIAEGRPVDVQSLAPA